MSKKETETKAEKKAPTKIVTKPKFKKLENPNRIRLHYMEFGDLQGTLIGGATIEGYNFRTKPMRGCKMKDSIFKSCNFTGCNWTGADIQDCTFIDCKMQFGAALEGLKEKNEFINCRMA